MTSSSSDHGTTEQLAWPGGDSSELVTGAPQPGVLLVFSEGRPTLLPIPLRHGIVRFSRGDVGGLPVNDTTMSRRHAEVSFADGRWSVRDLGSRNGTFVDGIAVEGVVTRETVRVLRVGESLALLVPDLQPFLNATISVRDGMVVGPTLRKVWEEAEQAAAGGESLLILGETGCGKELVARHYHEAAGTASRPFVAVNCAAVPTLLAERMFFGAKRGAFSGADRDVDGFIVTAHGGTLFLDEVAELDVAVQAKLLRVLEVREVLPLGMAVARKVELNVCSATHVDLREGVQQGRFRADLFFRLARRIVKLPPLRHRPEEIPWLVRLGLETAVPHPSLVEAAILRHWPGNVRELLDALRVAASRAAANAKPRVDATDLGSSAGVVADAGTVDDQRPAATPGPRRGRRMESRNFPGIEVVAEALRAEEGNVARAARRLNVHRTQLRRWIDRYGIDPRLQP